MLRDMQYKKVSLKCKIIFEINHPCLSPILAAHTKLVALETKEY